MSGAHTTGKGDRDRTLDRARFERNHQRTYGQVTPRRGKWRVVGGDLVMTDEAINKEERRTSRCR